MLILIKLNLDYYWNKKKYVLKLYLFYLMQKVLQKYNYLDEILLKCITVHQVLQPLITVCATTQNRNEGCLQWLT